MEKSEKIRDKLRIIEALGGDKYKVKIYPKLIVSSLVDDKEELDLPIENDDLSCCQDTILNLLEVVIYNTTGRHLFGIEELTPLVKYNPNKMTKFQYFETIKKAFKFLEIDYEDGENHII